MRPINRETIHELISVAEGEAFQLRKTYRMNTSCINVETRLDDIICKLAQELYNTLCCPQNERLIQAGKELREVIRNYVTLAKTRSTDVAQLREGFRQMEGIMIFLAEGRGTEKVDKQQLEPALPVTAKTNDYLDAALRATMPLLTTKEWMLSTPKMDGEKRTVTKAVLTNLKEDIKMGLPKVLVDGEYVGRVVERAGGTLGTMLIFGFDNECKAGLVINQDNLENVSRAMGFDYGDGIYIETSPIMGKKFRVEVRSKKVTGKNGDFMYNIVTSVLEEVKEEEKK